MSPGREVNRMALVAINNISASCDIHVDDILNDLGVASAYLVPRSIVDRRRQIAPLLRRESAAARACEISR